MQKMQFAQTCTSITTNTDTVSRAWSMRQKQASADKIQWQATAVWPPSLDRY